MPPTILRMPFSVAAILLCISLVGYVEAQAPVEWLRSEVQGTDDMEFAECTDWAAGADVCATADDIRDASYLKYFVPGAYEADNEWSNWAYEPSGCMATFQEYGWPSGCLGGMTWFGPSDFTILYKDGLLALFVTNESAASLVKSLRERDAAAWAARESEHARRLTTIRQSNLDGMSLGEKVRALADDFFRLHNMTPIECEGVVSGGTRCAATHGDTEVFMSATDVYLDYSEWFDGEAQERWSSSGSTVSKELVIDGREVSLRFVGALGPFENYGRVAIGY